VQQGGSLTLAGQLGIDGNTVTGGSGGSGGAPTGSAAAGTAGGAGSAFGAAMFLQGSGTLTFAPGARQTQVVADGIADQTGSGGTGNNAGSWGLVLNGAGTLLLLGVHTYSGGTAIASGTLELGFRGSVAGNVTFMGAGAALQFDQSVSQIGGDIVRAAPGNAIDLRYQLFTSGEHAVWQQTAGQSGTLTLLDGSGAVLANLNLVGRYATSQFITASDAAAGTSIFLQQPQNPGPPGNSTADMIMTDGNGDYEIYDIGGNAILAAYLLGQAPPPLTFVGLGTFQAGDTSDMMLRSASTGAFEVYDIANNNITGAAALGTVGLNWQVAGFGNFSSLGETDMILRDGSSGGFQVYDIKNNQITASAFMGAVGLDWQFSGVGNFSGRGESDMLLRNASNGGLEVYNISNNQITGAAFIGTVGLDWQFSGVGNFSGVPGETDLLLRNVNTGGLEVYDINNNQITGAAFIGTVGLDWQFAGIAPIQAPGTSDLVLRNANTGQFQVYNIANNQITGSASLGQVGLDWQLGGFAPATSAAAGVSDADDHASRLVQAMSSFSPDAGPSPGVTALEPQNLQAAQMLAAPFGSHA
jgi:autotransporter-associated beta strand protein